MNIPDEVIDPGWDRLGAMSRKEARALFEPVAIRAAEWARKDGRRQALLDAHAFCTTTTDAGAITRLIEAERTEADG